MMDDLTEFALSSEQLAIKQRVRDFVEEVIDPIDLREYEWADDPRDRVPWEIIDEAHARGLQDLTVPEEYGGMEASALTLIVAAEELGSGDMSMAINIDQMWKVCRIIAEMAPESLRDRFFTEFVDDPRHLLSMGLTEPANGSNYLIDYEDMQFDTVAERDGDDWIINGQKRFISCLPEAKTIVLYAQTDPNVSAQAGTTAFLVPTDAPGVEISNIWERIAVRHHNQGTINFSDVRVPADHQLGDINAAKQNTGQVLRESNIEAGAIAIGTARRAFADALEYAHERVQGGTEIINHQLVADDFARMATDLQHSRSMLWTAAQAVDALESEYDPVLGQMAKVKASTTAVDICQRALEQFGAAGVMIENDRAAEKRMRDSLIYLHADGTVNAHYIGIGNTVVERYKRG